MIYQRSPGVVPAIAESGCYFMALAEAAAKRSTGLLFTVPLINSVFNRCVSNGYMHGDCYILHPDKILELFGLQATYLGKMNRPCADNEFELLHWYYAKNNWHHFTGGDGEGHTSYDPWGVSITATLGVLKSKRLFRLIS
jgi:hypothetical protein